MYNILITDDERIVIDSLSFIVQRNFPDEAIVFSAKSGAEAIEKIHEQNIDIVFMDINMPGINGLEAINAIKQVNPMIVVIILTAFDRFQYAQEAINLGAYKYLTKPFNKNTIISTIRDAMSLIDKERIRQTSDIEIREKLNFVSSIVENDFIYTAIFSSDKDRDIESYLSYFNILKKDWFFLVIEIPNIDSETKLEKYIQIRDILSSCCDCITSSLMMNRIVVFVSNDECFNTENELVNSIYSRLSLKISAGIKIGVSSIQKTTDNTVAAYNEALEALYAAFCGEYGLAFYGENQSINQNGSYGTTAAIEVLSRIKAGDVTGVRTKFDEWFEYTVKNYQNDESKLKTSIFELLINAKNIAIEADKNFNPQSFDQIFAFLANSNTQDEIRSFIVLRLIECTSFINENVSKLSNPIISKTCRFINDNLDKFISLESTASFVQVSPFYLSKLFKEKTGDNFIDYVTSVRLNKAKELLGSKEYSIKEISHLTGYSDQNYFSRIFRRRYGLTPTEYRNSIQLGG